MSDWFDGAGNGGSAVDVAKILDCDAGEALAELAQLGALVSMGTTRDGGALAITVTVDGRWKRGYMRTSEDLTDWMAEAVPAVRAATEALAASAAREQRPRRSRGL